jgi:hypothetical protein
MVIIGNVLTIVSTKVTLTYFVLREHFKEY